MSQAVDQLLFIKCIGHAASSSVVLSERSWVRFGRYSERRAVPPGDWLTEDGFTGAPTDRLRPILQRGATDGRTLRRRHTGSQSLNRNLLRRCRTELLLPVPPCFFAL